MSDAAHYNGTISGALSGRESLAGGGSASGGTNRFGSNTPEAESKNKDKNQNSMSFGNAVTEGDSSQTIGEFLVKQKAAGNAAGAAAVGKRVAKVEAARLEAAARRERVERGMDEYDLENYRANADSAEWH